MSCPALDVPTRENLMELTRHRVEYVVVFMVQLVLYYYINTNYRDAVVLSLEVLSLLARSGEKEYDTAERGS